MRNQLKKLSSNNFSLHAEETEAKLSELEHQKMKVGFLTNKIAPENAEDMFEELRELITLSQTLSEVFINKMIEKCSMEFKTIEFYVSFLCKFTKI